MKHWIDENRGWIFQKDNITILLGLLSVLGIAQVPNKEEFVREQINTFIKLKDKDIQEQRNLVEQKQNDIQEIRDKRFSKIKDTRTTAKQSKQTEHLFGAGLFGARENGSS